MGCTSFMSLGTTPPKPIPTPEEFAKMEFGAPLSIDYQKIIKEYFYERLKDPYSAKIEFSQQPPQPFWFRDALGGQKEYTGFAVMVWVNAKNSYGGYTGKKQYGFIFKDNVIVKIIDPVEFDLMNSENPLGAAITSSDHQ